MIALRPEIKIVESGDSRVVLDTKRGVYWHLNESAIDLLEELARGVSLDDIVARVASGSGIAPEVVRADYLECIRELKRARLIEVRH